MHNTSSKVKRMAITTVTYRRWIQNEERSPHPESLSLVMPRHCLSNVGYPAVGQYMIVGPLREPSHHNKPHNFLTDISIDLELKTNQLYTVIKELT